MIQITKTSLFCLLGLTAGLAAQGDAVDLRIKSQKGATVWLSQESKMENTIDMGGQEMETGTTTTTIAQFTVKDVEESGTLVIETKVARIHGAMTMPMQGDIEFDSAQPSQGGMAAMTKPLTALAGKTFVAKVSPHGKVTALEGVEDMVKKGKSNPMMPSGPSEAQLKALVEGAFGVLPETPLAIGASWEHEARESGEMPGTKMKLTLAKVDDATFEITGTGTVDQPKPNANGKGNPMLDSLKIASSKAEGTQRVSRKDGFIVDAAHTMTMDASAEGPMGEMSMVVKVVTTTRRTTADAAMPPKAVTPPKEEGGE